MPLAKCSSEHRYMYVRGPK